jgi:hypothetical protein
MLKKIVSHRFYCCISVSFLIGLFSLNVQGQYLYSKADAKAIQKNRQLGSASFENTDRKAHYNIGLFFESIYKKYKDSSIHAAVRHYQASVLSEGEIGLESQMAAFQLGRIYETGMGIPINYDKALAYYLVSGEMGKKYQDEIVKRICPSDSVVAYAVGVRGQQTDSVVIRFHPFCALASVGTMTTLSELALYLKANPHLNVRLSTSGPQETITSYYNLWTIINAGDRVCQQVRHYLMDQGVGVRQFSYSCHKVHRPSTEYQLIIELTETQEKD